MTVAEAPPKLPLPTQDEMFLHGVDLDSPASMARSIAMQIRVRGHYQGSRCADPSSACLVASAAFSKASMAQKLAFEDAMARHIGDHKISPNGISLVWWNDHTRTEVVIQTLETLPYPDVPAEGTCDR